MMVVIGFRKKQNGKITKRVIWRQRQDRKDRKSEDGKGKRKVKITLLMKRSETERNWDKEKWLKGTEPIVNY